MSYLGRKRRRDIGRQRWQFLAVGITVAVGIMLFAATYDSYRNLTASYQETYRRLSFADMTIAGGDDGLAKTLAEVRGVAAVEVRHTVDLPVRIGDTTLRGRLVGMPVGSEPAVNRLDVTTGSGLTDPGAADAVAEVHLARTFGLAPGDTLTILAGNEPRLSVVGVAASAEYIWPAASQSEVFVDPNQFGVLFVDDVLLEALDTPDMVRETLVRYEDGTDVAATDAAVTAAAQAAGATGITTQADQPSNATLQLDVEGFGQMAFAFPLLFLAAAGMAVFVLLTRLVTSQRAVIGALRASGMSAATLRDRHLGFGLLIGLVAAVMGVVAGIAAGAAMTSLYTGLLDIPDTVVELRPETFVAGLLFGVVAGLVSAWVPARAAYRTAPAEAMRGAAPVSGGGRSLLERLLPPLARLPVRTRMTLRGIGRARRRSLSTVIGVVLALVLVLSAGGLIDSVVATINQQFDAVALEDATAIASQPLDDPLVDAVRGVPGVAAAEATVSLPASLTRNGTTVSTVLGGFEAGTAMHGWETLEPGAPGGSPSVGPPAGGLTIARSLADKLAMGPGDRVSVELPTLGVTVDMAIVATVQEPLGLPMYAQTEDIAVALASAGVGDPTAALAAPGTAAIMAIFQQGADRSAVLGAIGGLDGIVAVQDALAVRPGPTVPGPVLRVHAGHARVRGADGLRSHVQHDLGQHRRAVGRVRHPQGERHGRPDHRLDDHGREPAADGGRHRARAGPRHLGCHRAHGQLQQRFVLVRGPDPAADVRGRGRGHAAGRPAVDAARAA
ncbi:MAG: ABC transporter permease [Chloroflexota bacterium]